MRFYPQYSIDAMMLDRYLKFVFLLTVFDSIFFTVSYSASIDLSLAQLIIAARFVIDVVFLIFAWRYINLRKVELILLLLIIASCIFVTLPLLNYSSAYSMSRFLNDISLPLIFILKVSALRSLFSQNINAILIKKLSKNLFYLSLIQVIIFLVISAQTGAYVGITPPVNIPAAFFIATFNYVGLGAITLLVVFSGKRSFLVSIAIVSLFVFLFRGGWRIRLGFFALISFLLALFAFTGNDKIMNTVDAASQLLEVTDTYHFDFYSEEIRSILYSLTGGRSEEFYAIMGAMRPLSWIIGLGPGFTYDILYFGDMITGYANSHFSPLSLSYKFGLIFALILYGYLIGPVLKLMKFSGPLALILASIVSLFILQSMFAFNLFSEPYFPIFFALAMAVVSDGKGRKSHDETMLVDQIRLPRAN